MATMETMDLETLLRLEYSIGDFYARKETDGRALHWDMICDLRQQGEVWVDDELFLKNGKYVLL